LLGIILPILILLIIGRFNWWTEHGIINSQIQFISKGLLENNPVAFEKYVYFDTVFCYEGKSYQYSDIRNNLGENINNRSVVFRTKFMGEE
jgi:hypothetical protein